MPRREKIWKKLASEWKLDGMDKVVSEIPLRDIDARIDDMLAGRHKGRTVITMV
jgi:acrylyl-CoA reductase (NADPH)